MVRGYIVGIVTEKGTTEMTSPTPIKVTPKENGYFFISDGNGQDIWVRTPMQILMKKVDDD